MEERQKIRGATEGGQRRRLKSEISEGGLGEVGKVLSGWSREGVIGAWSAVTSEHLI